MDGGTHGSGETKAIRQAKWLFPILLGVGSAVVGYVVKSAVLEHRLEEVEEMVPGVRQNAEDTAVLKVEFAGMREDLTDVKETTREINDKLSTITFTRARRRQ